MNNEVREYLIEVAREDESTVYYSELINDNSLRIDLSTADGQNQLKQLLIEVSTYENDNGRPMLTALAINKREKDQGSGFYELAERFGFGKKSILRKAGWGKEEADRVRKFWKDDNNYKQFAKLVKVKKQPNKITRLFETLINSDEYIWAEDWSDTYIAFVKDVKELQHSISENPQLGIDNNKLYKKLSQPIQSYESFMLKWLKENRNGISSRGQSVLSADNFNSIINDASFKTISKVLISNPTANTYSLLVDWWYGNEDITNRPLLINRAVAACLPEKLSSTVDNKKFWYVVEILKKHYGFTLDEEREWNWFTANEQLTQWLDQQLISELAKISNDKVERIIWRNIFVWLIYERYFGKPSIPANELIRRDPPKDGFNEFPQANTKEFVGREADFEKIARIQKELGDAGEELVMQYEIRQIKKRGMNDLVKSVRIAKPGEGFDVYSFDENGNEKFIEVKTTTGDRLNKFHLTRNEINFLRTHQQNYSIYRVYNFDEENNSGEYFELVGDIEPKIILEPIQYEVLIKKKH